jgi:class 3 adenylate cyclase
MSFTELAAGVGLPRQTRRNFWQPGGSQKVRYGQDFYPPAVVGGAPIGDDTEFTQEDLEEMQALSEQLRRNELTPLGAPVAGGAEPGPVPGWEEMEESWDAAAGSALAVPDDFAFDEDDPEHDLDDGETLPALREPCGLSAFDLGDVSVREGRLAEPSVFSAPPVATSADGRLVLMSGEIADFAERIGSIPESRVGDILRTFDTLVGCTVRTHAGMELRCQAGSFIVAFAKAYDALVCAVAVQRALRAYDEGRRDVLLPLRIGLHPYEPVNEGYNGFAKAELLAARIAKAGDGRQILVSEQLRQLADGLAEVRFDEGPPLEIEGHGVLQRLFELVWQ